MTRSLILSTFLTLAACGSTPPPAASPAPAAADDAPAASEPDADADADAAPVADVAAPPDPAQIKAELLAVETRAYEGARPVFETYCSGCHSQGGAGAKKKTLDHFDMSSYPFGGHHVATMGPTIQHVLGLDGSRPSMPMNKKGAVQGDELALVKTWTEAWQAADDGGAHSAVAHEGHQH